MAHLVRSGAPPAQLFEHTRGHAPGRTGNLPGLLRARVLHTLLSRGHTHTCTCHAPPCRSGRRVRSSCPARQDCARRCLRRPELRAHARDVPLVDRSGHDRDAEPLRPQLPLLLLGGRRSGLGFRLRRKRGLRPLASVPRDAKDADPPHHRRRRLLLGARLRCTAEIQGRRFGRHDGDGPLQPFKQHLLRPARIQSAQLQLIAQLLRARRSARSPRAAYWAARLHFELLEVGALHG